MLTKVKSLMFSPRHVAALLSITELALKSCKVLPGQRNFFKKEGVEVGEAGLDELERSSYPVSQRDSCRTFILKEALIPSHTST